MSTKNFIALCNFRMTQRKDGFLSNISTRYVLSLITLSAKCVFACVHTCV